MTRVFLIFLVVLVLAAVLNIFSSHLMAVMNNVSVWWHVVGRSAIVLILILVPDQHQSFSYVFTERFNNSGFSDGATNNFAFWFAIVPFGFLLTQYTITGFDASAHLSEETASASKARPRASGARSSTRSSGATSSCSAFVFAIPNDGSGNPDNAGVGAGGVAFIFTPGAGSELGHAGPVHLGVGAVLLRHVVHDIRVPDDVRVQPRRRDPRFGDAEEAEHAQRCRRTPSCSSPSAAAIVTLPALIEVNIGTEADR